MSYRAILAILASFAAMGFIPLQQQPQVRDALVVPVASDNMDSNWQPPTFSLDTSVQSTNPANSRIPVINGQTQTGTNPNVCVPVAGNTTLVSRSGCVTFNGAFGPGVVTMVTQDTCGTRSSSTSSCSIAPVQEPCIGMTAVAGQVSCPTNSCFFYVGGLPVSDVTQFGQGRQGSPGRNTLKIGDVTESWEGGSGGNAGGNIVGLGEYPDAYGSGGNQGPFYNAAEGTFDGMAIGARTRVRIYKGRNYSGDLIFDKTGPLIINNTYGPDYYADLTRAWISGGVFDQFPPSTRHAASDPAMGIPPAPLSPAMAALFVGQDNPRLWQFSGISDGVAGFGPTSVKVTCE